MSALIKMSDFDIKKLEFSSVKDKTVKGNSSIKYKSITFGYAGTQEPPVIKIPFPIFCFGVQKKQTTEGKDASKGFSVCFSIPERGEGKEFGDFIENLYNEIGGRLEKVGKEINKQFLTSKKESWANVFPSPLYPPKDKGGNKKLYTNLICFATDNKQSITSERAISSPSKDKPSDTSHYSCQTLLKTVVKFSPDGKVLESKVIDPLGKEAQGNYKMMPAIQLRGLFIGKDIRLQIDLFNGIIFPRNSTNTQDLMNEELSNYISTIGKDKISMIGNVSGEEAAAAGSPDEDAEDSSL